MYALMQKEGIVLVEKILFVLCSLIFLAKLLDKILAQFIMVPLTTYSISEIHSTKNLAVSGLENNLHIIAAAKI